MNRKSLGYRQGIVSILANLLLFGLKYWAGIVSGSLALLADAWHTLSDSISSVIVIIGIRLAARKPDTDHPFGHGRWEQISAIFVAFFLGIIAFNFLKKSIDKFNSHESAEFGLIAIIVTIISILVKEGLAQYAFFITKRTGNDSIKGDGWHHRSDALSSVVVLIGIFLNKYIWWIDSALGLLISILLFYAVFMIIKSTISKILGEKPPDELIDNVKEIIHSVEPAGIHPHHFHLHHYGTHQELTFHVKFDKNTDLVAAHTTVSKIEKKVYDQLAIVSTIHIEPKDVEHEMD